MIVINSLLSEVSAQYQELLNGVITRQRQQLSQLQELLQLLIIKTNQSKLEQKSTIKENIIDLRNQVQVAYQSINQQGVNPQLVKQLHSFIKGVVEHLEQVGKKFSDLKPLSEEQFTRQAQKEPDFGTIQQEAADLTTRLSKLEKYAEIADLTKLEHTARLVSDYFLSPLYRHRHALLCGAGAVNSSFDLVFL